VGPKYQANVPAGLHEHNPIGLDSHHSHLSLAQRDLDSEPQRGGPSSIEVLGYVHELGIREGVGLFDMSLCNQLTHICTQRMNVRFQDSLM
jgi:hypothetical protein